VLLPQADRCVPAEYNRDIAEKALAYFVPMLPIDSSFR
jgi:hypothetical protein